MATAAKVILHVAWWYLLFPDFPCPLLPYLFNAPMCPNVSVFVALRLPIQFTTSPPPAAGVNSRCSTRTRIPLCAYEPALATVSPPCYQCATSISALFPPRRRPLLRIRSTIAFVREWPCALIAAVSFRRSSRWSSIGSSGHRHVFFKTRFYSSSKAVFGEIECDWNFLVDIFLARMCLSSKIADEQNDVIRIYVTVVVRL